MLSAHVDGQSDSVLKWRRKQSAIVAGMAATASLAMSVGAVGGFSAIIPEQRVPAQVIPIVGEQEPPIVISESGLEVDPPSVEPATLKPMLLKPPAAKKIIAPIESTVTFAMYQSADRTESGRIPESKDDRWEADFGSGDDQCGDGVDGGRKFVALIPVPRSPSG